MKVEERPLRFPCHGVSLYGILSMPLQPHPRAVLIVVGGPQYRAGSHRQFVLLARALACNGYPVLRFDYRGMGDSEGEPRTFEQVDDDLRAAIDQLIAVAPMVREVVIWGLCDGASAAMFYAHQDHRVSGLVLVNPWVRTEKSEAKVRLTHYYPARLLDIALWKKIAARKFEYIAAARALWKITCRATSITGASDNVGIPLPDRLYRSLRLFKKDILIILSGNDLTAQEFREMAFHAPQWSDLMHAPRVTRFELAEANHTFSRRDWRDQVIDKTRDWLNGNRHHADRTSPHLMRCSDAV